MKTEELLYKFAEEHDIDILKVNEFIKQFSNPKTIEDLENTPIDLLNNFGYTSNIGENLKKFIIEYIDPYRYQTVTLIDITDVLSDYQYDLEEGYINKEDEIFIEKVKEELIFIEKVKEELIEYKFGSVRYDW